MTDQQNEEGIRTALTSFSSVSEKNVLERAYHLTVKRMESQPPNNLDLAKRTIDWITNTKRPLTVAELEEAIAIKIGSSDFDETNFTAFEQLKSYCCGVVTVDDVTQHVKLIHSTTQTYFEGLWETWFPEAHEIISNSSLTYVAYDSFEEAASVSVQAQDALLEKRPFHKYAVQYWGRHFREHPGSHSMALGYLSNQKNVRIFGFYYQKLERRFTYFFDSDGNAVNSSSSIEIRGIHLASRFGLCDLINSLLDDDPIYLDI